MGLKKKAEEPVAVNTEENPVEKKEIDASETSMERLNSSIELLTRKFGLDESYILTAFKDAGSSIKITMSNKDFEINATIKHPDLYGIELPTLD